MTARGSRDSRIQHARVRPGVGRAAVVVAAIVAGAIGHLALTPATGARTPGSADAAPARSFQPLDAQRLESVDRAATQDDHATGPDTTSGTGPGVDAWGLTGAAGAGDEPSATLVPWFPEIVRFRPRDGWTDVDRQAELSVRFTTSMDHPSTEGAFHATLDGTELAGSRRWAEGDTVLVLRPSAALPYGSHVTLRVDAGALSAAGLPVVEAVAVSFTVEARPAAPSSSGGSTSAGSTQAGWQWPLVGPITQGFGQSLTVYGFHQGIDIDGDTGDPVVAARAGRVVVAGYADECGGLQVRIDHGDGLLTWYRHLSAIDTSVGARVAAGTMIGRVGNTGCSLGSHLHFGVSLDGTFVDPLRYLPPR